MSNPSERDKNIKKFRRGLKKWEKASKDFGTVVSTQKKLQKPKKRRRS